VEPALRDLAERLAAAGVARAVVLFGSRARGEALDTSDADVAVISPRFEGLSPLERGELLYRFREPGLRVDLLGFTPDELLGMSRPMLWDVLRDGRPLYDDGAFAEARLRFERLIAEGRIEPVPGGWRFRE